MLYPVLQDPLHQIVSSLFDRPRGASIGQMLFGAGEQGAWYDVADMSTLFQDAAGATPVTAVEQPVGRILDKSGRGNHAAQATTTKRPTLSRRYNLLTNTGFAGYVPGPAATATLPTNWTAPGATGSIASAPVGVRVVCNAERLHLRQNLPVKAGEVYRCTVHVDVAVGLTIGQALGNTQALSTSEYFLDGAAVSMSTAVPSGLHKLEVRYTITTDSAAFAMIVGAGVHANATGDITLLSAQVVRETDVGIPYQAVNTAGVYDADPSKFPAYLCFDGVDDALQTGNIDFTSTDKMTVWAGITKLSDAVANVLVELSATANTNNGAWKVLASEPPGTKITASSRGTATNAANQLAEISAAAPGSFVLSSASDIAGDLVTLRVNSIAAPQAVGDQGAGNYGNYPLYIGARAGTSLYFNGRLYSLIVRGAQTQPSQIEATDRYIKQKMRMP